MLFAHPSIKVSFLRFTRQLGISPISFLKNEIRKYKPRYLFIETTYIHELYLIFNDYQIDFFNEIVIILKLKNINSIKKYFILN